MLGMRDKKKKNPLAHTGGKPNPLLLRVPLKQAQIGTQVARHVGRLLKKNTRPYRRPIKQGILDLEGTSREMRLLDLRRIGGLGQLGTEVLSRIDRESALRRSTGYTLFEQIRTREDRERAEAANFVRMALGLATKGKARTRRQDKPKPRTPTLTVPTSDKPRTDEGRRPRPMLPAPPSRHLPRPNIPELPRRDRQDDTPQLPSPPYLPKPVPRLPPPPEAIEKPREIPLPTCEALEEELAKYGIKADICGRRTQGVRIAWREK